MGSLLAAVAVSLGSVYAYKECGGFRRALDGFFELFDGQKKPEAPKTEPKDGEDK